MMGETLSYVVNSAAWSAAGFMLGWVFFRYPPPRHAKEETGSMRDWDRRNIPRWIGVVFIVMAILTVGQATWTTWQQQEQSECQARVNSQFIETLSARAEATEDDRRALMRLARTIVNQPQQAEEALERYSETLQRTAEKRERNPYPPLPEDTCD